MHKFAMWNKKIHNILFMKSLINIYSHTSLFQLQRIPKSSIKLFNNFLIDTYLGHFQVFSIVNMYQISFTIIN